MKFNIFMYKNITTSMWINKKFDGFDGQTCVLIGEYIYFFGGIYTNKINKPIRRMRKMNVNTRILEYCSDEIHSREYGVSMCVFKNDFIVLFGGFTIMESNASIPQLTIYDTKTCKSKVIEYDFSDFNEFSIWQSNICAYGDTIYLITGGSISGVVNKLYSFNINTKIWRNHNFTNQEQINIPFWCDSNGLYYIKNSRIFHLDFEGRELDVNILKDVGFDYSMSFMPHFITENYIYKYGFYIGSSLLTILMIDKNTREIKQLNKRFTRPPTCYKSQMIVTLNEILLFDSCNMWCFTTNVKSLSILALQKCVELKLKIPNHLKFMYDVPLDDNLQITSLVEK